MNPRRACSIPTLYAACVLLWTGPTLWATEDDAAWWPVFGPPGVNGPVMAAAAHRGDLYVGGRFTEAGGVPARNLARWDGRRWYAVDGGTDGEVHALLSSEDGLYLGGVFTTAGGVTAAGLALWNGTAWREVGGGVDGDVKALAQWGPRLFVGGRFTRAGSTPANSIAVWDTVQWNLLGTGTTNGVEGEVQAILLLSDYDAMVGGRFPRAGGVLVNSVARWNQGVWSGLGNGVREAGPQGPVAGLVTSFWRLDDGRLFVGGRFTEAGAQPAIHLAAWDGNQWTGLTGSLGPAPDTQVNALWYDSDGLLAGGTFQFTDVDGLGVTGLARWDAPRRQWLAATRDADGPQRVNVFAMYNSLTFGGDFTQAAGVRTRNVALLAGRSAYALGLGTEGQVRALGLFGRALLLGGDLQSVAGWPVHNIGGFDFSQTERDFYPFQTDAGVDHTVHGLTRQPGSNLWVAGAFSTADGLPAPGVALWWGGWSTPGEGPNGPAYAVAAAERWVFLGGCFTAVGTVTASNLVVRTDEGWQALNEGSLPGVDGPVFALAVAPDALFAGGRFTRAGAVPARNVARWDFATRTWTALGEGVTATDPASAEVHALLVRDGAVWVGGRFTQAGSLAAHHLARWTGSTWERAGTAAANGANGVVHALAAHGTNLYIGGEFAQAGSVPAQNVARWDGARWTALGSGTDGAVYALQPRLNDLFLGGAFAMAGGTPARGLALWRLGEIPRITLEEPLPGDRFALGAAIPVRVKLDHFVEPAVRVEFLLGSQVVGTRTNAPFAFTLPQQPAGDYRVYANASDAAGGFVSTDEVPFTIVQPTNNLLPTVRLTTPRDGQVFLINAPVTYTADAFDEDDGVARVEFHFGNETNQWNLRATVTNAPFTYTEPHGWPGEYPLVAKVVDRRGATAVSRPITFYMVATNLPPTLAVLEPFPGALFLDPPDIRLRAEVADLHGLLRVEFLANDTVLQTLRAETNAVYEFRWPTPAPGAYRLRVKATDRDGLTASESLQVQVASATHPPPMPLMPQAQPETGLPDADGPIHALVETQGILYVGGNFAQLGPLPRANLGAIDLATRTVTAWNPGADGPVYALETAGDRVLVAGAFTNVGSAARRGLAALAPATALAETWNPAVNGVVHTLLPVGGTLFFGGNFTEVAGEPRRNAAAVSLSAGAALPWDPAPDGRVRALAGDAATIYLAGEFTRAGHTARAGLAAVTATTGDALDWNPRLDGPVRALAWNGDDLFVGGDFRTAEGAARPGLARFAMRQARLSAWTAELDGPLAALAVADGLVYVAGGTLTVSGTPQPGLAAFEPRLPGANAVDWRPLAGTADVAALCVRPWAVYAAGTFTPPGSSLAQRLVAFPLPDHFGVTPLRPPTAASLRFHGRYGHRYALERATDLPVWSGSATNRAPFDLSRPPGTVPREFYRTRYLGP